MRKNGFQQPLDAAQVAAWLLIPIYAAGYYFILLPFFFSPFSLILTITFSSLLLFGIYFKIRCTIINPGDLQLRQKPSHLPSFFHEIKNSQFCSICNTRVCKTAKHCRLCQKCVPNFDHHCRYTNNCISKSSNYPHFFVLLTVMTVASLLILIFFFLFLSIISSILLLQLFLFHVKLFRLGLTTYEYIVKQRKLEKISVETNCCSNFKKMVFTPSCVKKRRTSQKKPVIVKGLDLKDIKRNVSALPGLDDVSHHEDIDPPDAFTPGRPSKSSLDSYSLDDHFATPSAVKSTLDGLDSTLPGYLSN
ncbi:hypothetical protein GEMRC1_007881 [Eukaryota sp. GEM-RC1]